MEALVSDYPFIVRQAADAEFIAYVQNLIQANSDKFQPNRGDPERRKYWPLKDDIDRLLEMKKRELTEKFGISDWVVDPTYHDLIGYIAEGGSVRPHKDADIDGRSHVRINVLVQKPERGCVPLLDGIPIDIGLGDAWLCFAGLCRHSTTPVEGAKFRSIISYGLQVDRSEALPFLAQYVAWKMSHAQADAQA
jgi:hypothetical protein